MKVEHDTQVTGLQLRTRIKGKAWFLYYRTKAGVERRPKLGDYPTLTAADARRAAREILAKVAAGHDPSAKWQEDRAASTMADLWTRYWTEHAPRKKSRAEDHRLWTTVVAPALSHRRVAEIQTADIQGLHRNLQRTPVQANRVLSLCSRMLSLSERWGWRGVGTNPCQHVERYPEHKRRRYASRAELQAIAAALDVARKQHPREVAFIELLMFTGARCGEIESARWEWLAGNSLHLPDSKTGACTIYLPPQAMNVLANLPTKTGTLTGVSSPVRLWQRIREEAGCPDLRLHDLRHSFASAGLSAGLTLGQIGELLRHSSTQTTKRYAHLMDEAAHAAAAVAADRIAAFTSQRPAPSQTCEARQGQASQATP